MDSRLLQYYDELLKEHGAYSPESLGWRNAASQLDRFRVLSEVGDLSGRSMLDEGCGLGDLYGFLAERVGDFSYTGIDINERLIANAANKYPTATFKVADFSEYEGELVDYVLASGTLTFRIPNHAHVYRDQIKKMYALARIGVAFNVLDERYFPGNEEYVTYSVSELYEFCARLTNKIVVRHDYSPEDVTFYLYR